MGAELQLLDNVHRRVRHAGPGVRPAQGGSRADQQESGAHRKSEAAQAILACECVVGLHHGTALHLRGALLHLGASVRAQREAVRGAGDVGGGEDDDDEE